MPTTQQAIQAIIDNMRSRFWCPTLASDGKDKMSTCQIALDGAIETVTREGRDLLWPTGIQKALYVLCHATIEGDFASRRPGMFSFFEKHDAQPRSLIELTALDMTLRTKVKAAIDTAIDAFIKAVITDGVEHEFEARPELTVKEVVDIFGLKSAYRTTEDAIKAAKDGLKAKVDEICSAPTTKACMIYLNNFLSSVSTSVRNVYSTGAAAGASSEVGSWREQFVKKLNTAFPDEFARLAAGAAASAAAGGPRR